MPLTRTRDVATQQREASTSNPPSSTSSMCSSPSAATERNLPPHRLWHLKVVRRWWHLGNAVVVSKVTKKTMMTALVLLVVPVVPCPTKAPPRRHRPRLHPMSPLPVPAQQVPRLLLRPSPPGLRWKHKTRFVV